jgi:hypothetical protein
MMRAVAFVVSKLGWRTREIAVMEQQLQPADDLLRTTAHQCHDLIGTQKTVPVNLPDDVMVAAGQFDRGNCGSAFEAGKTGHSATLPLFGKSMKTGKLAVYYNNNGMVFPEKALTQLSEICKSHLILKIF